MHAPTHLFTSGSGPHWVCFPVRASYVRSGTDMAWAGCLVPFDYLEGQAFPVSMSLRPDSDQLFLTHVHAWPAAVASRDTYLCRKPGRVKARVTRGKGRGPSLPISQNSRRIRHVGNAHVSDSARYLDTHCASHSLPLHRPARKGSACRAPMTM